MPHFHHFSICNQNQSISNLVNCEQNTKAILWLKLTYLHYVSVWNEKLSRSNGFFCVGMKALWSMVFAKMFVSFVICESPTKISEFECDHMVANRKAVASFFGQKSFIVITRQLKRVNSMVSQVLAT